MADLAVVSVNKVKNGAVKFSEFSRQMVAEFGEKVRPRLIELYQDAFAKVHGVRKNLGIDELLGGHTIERHIGKSDSWLRKRLLTNKRIDAASTFRNEAIADRTISQFVKQNRSTIDAWLRSGDHRLEVQFTMNEPVGRVIGRGKGGAPLGKSVETDTVQIVLIRDNTPNGWHVNTSFPIASKGVSKW